MKMTGRLSVETYADMSFRMLRLFSEIDVALAKQARAMTPKSKGVKRA